MYSHIVLQSYTLHCIIYAFIDMRIRSWFECVHVESRCEGKKKSGELSELTAAEGLFSVCTNRVVSLTDLLTVVPYVQQLLTFEITPNCVSFLCISQFLSQKIRRNFCFFFYFLETTSAVIFFFFWGNFNN